MRNHKWKGIFILTWLFFSWQLGFFQHMKKGPFGVHQGAQADRACIALNYYEDDMNLFLPRVNETRGETGIVGCELPIVNYTAAISYKIFGFNDRYYRVIMWLIIFFGLYAVFQTFTLFLKSKLLSLILAFTWYLSPILVYYTPNYLPDTASMSLNMIGLYFFMSYYKGRPKMKYISLGVMFMTLAALIKITSLILPISILLLVILSNLFKKRQSLKTFHFELPLRWAFGIGLTFIIAFSWYKYSAFLNAKHNTSLFFLEGKWAGSLEEFKEWFHVFQANWLNLIYNKIILVTLFISYLLCLVKYFKKNLLLAILSTLYLLGSLAFFLLMTKQFRYHDYYVICLLPTFLLMLLYIAKTIEGLNLRFIPKTIIGLFAFSALVFNYNKAKGNIKSRYTPGDYWEQSFFYEEDFKFANEVKKKHGITRDENIFVAYDLNPNVMLYFLNLKGYKIAPDFTKEHLTSMYLRAKPRILVLNDSSYFSNHHPLNLNIKFIEIAKSPNMTFYELEYPKADGKNE